MLGLLRRLNAELVIGFLAGTIMLAAVLGWLSAYTPTEKEKDKCRETAEKAGFKTEECKTFWERTTSDPVAFFTLVLTCSTVGLWGATIMLYGAGERQIEISSKSVDAALKSVKVAEQSLFDLERPYLFIEEPMFEQSGKPRVLKYVFKNYGRTPATLRWVEATSTIQDESGKDTRTDFFDIFNSTFTFGAGESHGIVPNIGTGAGRNSFPNGSDSPRTFPFLSVEIQYFDIFGWVHCETFRFFESSGRFNAFPGERKSYRQNDREAWHPRTVRNIPPPSA